MEGRKGFKTGGIHSEKLEKLKKNLKVGDPLIYVKVIKDSDDKRLLIPVKIAVRVKAKYPYIVEVEEIGGSPYPVKTMTYTEILVENAMCGNKKEKERRRRKQDV